ncbi:MAG: HU family DNA-binding protein [Prevotella sp.]|nr:HU family DNA-binding protein [Prevotella sp.]
MTVFYKLMKTHGSLPGNKELRIVPIANGTTGLKRISRNIQQATSLTPGDVAATIIALKEEIAQELKMGNNVHIPGLGYFSLSVRGDIYEDPRSHRYRLRNAAVRTVRFRPDTEFLKELCDTEFENMTYKTGTSAVPTTEAIDAALERLFADGGVFTVSDLRHSLHLSQSYAYTLAARLEAEGKIVNVGTRHRKLYRKA